MQMKKIKTEIESLIDSWYGRTILPWNRHYRLIAVVAAADIPGGRTAVDIPGVGSPVGTLAVGNPAADTHP